MTTSELSQDLELACRRAESRQQLDPVAVTCWGDDGAPALASSIELDERGARLVLPWYTEPGEFVRVSLKDELGQCETRAAHIVWTRTLEGSGKVVAGVAFADPRIAA